MMKPTDILLLLLCFFVTNTSAATDPTDTLKRKKRLKPLLITSGAGYAAGMLALNELWYSDFDRSSFHFFNDNNEWKQVDKAGHMYASFQLAAATHKALDWAGAEDRTVLYSTLASMAVISSIELFDGFSEAYGASAGDLIANAAGAGFYYGQQRLWNEIRLHPKFSFRRTGYAEKRPELLGATLSEEILKDYNGQTYWISVDISRFISTHAFPRWLNIAVGYGAHDFIYAEDPMNHANGYSPRRQYYLALDLDLSGYRSKSKFVNTIIYLVNMVHLPAPAVEFSDGEFKFFYLY